MIPAREIILPQIAPKNTHLSKIRHRKTEKPALTREADREVEDDSYMPPSEDEASLDDDEFVIPSDPAEQERFKRRLLATASSLKKSSNSLELPKNC